MTAPVPLRLRPLEIGDLLDETFRTYRRHFFLFAGISLALSIPVAVLSGGYAAFAGNSLQQLASGNAGNPAEVEGALVSLSAGLLLTLIFVPFIYSAVIYAACQSAMGAQVTAGGMVSGVVRRYFQLMGYWLLIGLMFTVGICLFPLWIWVSVAWVAVIPAMFVENIGLGAAMSRSWRLVEGRWWRTFFILFLMALVFYGLRIAMTAFTTTAENLLNIVVSNYLIVTIGSAADTIASALVNPVFQIAVVLIYFDLRVRREALDLFQLAQRVPSPLAVP